MNASPPRIGVPPQELLAEIEGLIRSVPSAEQLASDGEEALAWRGRALAAISAWSILKGNNLAEQFDRIDMNWTPQDRPTAMRQIRIILYEGRHAKMLEAGTSGGSVAMPAGAVFEYFSELTKRLQLAAREIFFVDPYLDAQFAERYLPQIGGGVAVRLLTAPSYISKLLPAADLFAKQNGNPVAVREAAFHDRFVFIDGTIGFQSGASFKDGATKSPTGLIEIVDALPAMLGQYETLWTTAKVHR